MYTLGIVNDFLVVAEKCEIDFLDLKSKLYDTVLYYAQSVFDQNVNTTL